MRLDLKRGTAMVLVAVGVLGVVWFLRGEGLDRAEKWVSIGGVCISTVIGVAGLFVAWRTWQQTRQNRRPERRATAAGSGAVGIWGNNRAEIRTEVSGVDTSTSSSSGRGTGVRAEGAGSVAVGGDNTAPISTRVTGLDGGRRP